MTKNLLVELGLEEMPAYVVKPSIKQLRQKMGQFFGNRFFDNKSYIYSFYYIRSCIIGIIYFK